jgi:CHAT domain-containing protein/cytochrome c-type biogenesis protein CcmH/NrfG
VSQEEKHLSIEQIECLIETDPGVVESTAQSGLAEKARDHLVTCEACQRLVSMHKEFEHILRGLREDAPKDAASGCPSAQSWNELAAGVLLHDDAERLLRHAIQCDHCGRLLRQAAETFSSQQTADEEGRLSSLQSSRSEWQASVAQKLAGMSLQDSVKPFLPLSLEQRRRIQIRPRNGWIYAAAAALVLATAAMSLLLWRSRPNYANRLLARAYTEHRTLEVRIAGAKYAPMRVERGAGASSLDKPASLLQAEALIVERLRKNPDDPSWLEAKGRADLLDGNYESAISSLQRALETQPDSPPLLTDLGSAYFLRAEAADRAIDYGNAIESLSRGLSKSPDEPVALFNRALASERMFLYAEAVNDWEHYLRVDPNGGWADDARNNLQRVKQKIAEREKRTAAPLLSPEAFSAAIGANHEDAAALLDQRTELYLETALQSWLPQVYGGSSSQATRGEARRALEYLAAILKDRHDDTWLVDFLQSPPSPIHDEALRSLLASDEALHAGQYGLSAELAEKSARDFERSRNRAGMLRASFALMLAQSFALKYADCLSTAASGTSLLSNTRYRWLQTQTLVQQGECQDSLAQEEDAIQSTSKGVEAARRFHYPSLELRAIAFEAGYRRGTGSADRGLRDLFNGLATFWETDVSSTRGENLYSALFNVAQAMNWHHVESFAIAEKIGDFPVKDPVDQAVGCELLASAEERAGDYKAAQASLQRATAQLATLPEDSGVVLRKAEISLENAEIELQLGDAKGALATLSGLRRQFETADPGLFQAEYFKTYGETYLSLGLNASAEPLLARALSVTETGLSSFPLEADKLQWSRMQGQIYRDLLEIKLKSGTPQEALALWEWYKSASIRAAATKDSKMSAEDGMRSFVPAAASGDTLTPGTALISYAVLKNSATVFVLRDGNVRSHALQLPSDPDLQVLRFLSLCADPSASLDSLQAESHRLYDILVAPLESDIKGATALRFETDGILDRIPFDLLRGADGRYLADRFEVTYSPGLAYGHHSRLETFSPASTALIVVASGAQEPGSAPPAEAAEEGRDVSSYFHEARTVSGSQATRAAVLQNLRSATVFHFVGHAVASADQVGLRLGRDAVVNSRDLVELRPSNLKLAVLSACDTANGDAGTPDDVNSIARTLAVAGVPQTVASRWKVDSVVTRELMRAFYSNLMSGKTPAGSLRAATVMVRNLPGYQHPYYWGSFAVFGSS